MSSPHLKSIEVLTPAYKEKLSLLVAAFLGEEFSFEEHTLLLDRVLTWSELTDKDIDTDLMWVNENIHLHYIPN